jgi:hypothetical protein
MNVVGAGARDYTKEVVVYTVLNWLDVAYGIDRISEGKQHGADALIRQWREHHERPGQSYEAFWTRLKRGAGPERNARMVKAEQPDLWIGFEGGSGTGNCMSEALKLPHCRCIHVASAEILRDRIDLTVTFSRHGMLPKITALSLLLV